jgi:hypothetical protein
MHANREQWLNAAAALVEPWFIAQGHKLPKVRIGIGFTSKGARSTRIGECWDHSCSADGVHEIFLVPTMSEPMDILQVLVHELIHAAVGLDAKHGPKFGKLARALHLEGKLTATTHGEAFRAAARPVLEALGPMPHARLSSGNSSAPKKQTTRMIKCTCGQCGYTVRAAKKWLDMAIPECPVDGTELTVDMPDESDGE